MRGDQPKVTVMLGLSDDFAFRDLCQLVTEGKGARLVAIHLHAEETLPPTDPVWAQVHALLPQRDSRFEILQGEREAVAAKLADRSIDLLIIDDRDDGEIIRQELQLLAPKLKEDAIVLLNGTELERSDPPRRAWAEFSAQRRTAEFEAGAGVALSVDPRFALKSSFRQIVFARSGRVEFEAKLHHAAVTEAGVEELNHLRKQNRVLQARQVWFETVSEDRGRAQLVMNHQATLIAGQVKNIAQQNKVIGEQAKVITRQMDRMHHLEEVLERTHADLATVRARVADLRGWIAAAKANCAKKGRCFDRNPNPRRSLSEKITREAARIFRRLQSNPTPGPPTETVVHEEIKSPLHDRYARWIAEHEPDEKELRRQRAASAEWAEPPRLSLLIPIYDPSLEFLDELFKSVVAQSYPHWEVCAVDGGSKNEKIATSLQRWAQRDPRIRVESLTENLGVSENTNRALRMATGQFIALVDHDDLLAPSALYRVAEAICAHPGADVFYTDEDRFTAERIRARPFFKPEWSPELLQSFMYLGHLGVYRRSVVEELGGFRKEFDLSQDYDLALRATEGVREIVHLPYVLYHWREHAASGAAGGKPEARLTNIAALRAAMERRGLEAEVTAYPGANRARLQPAVSRRVSIIIPTDSPRRAARCARELPSATQYQNFEIIIVTNTALIEEMNSSARRDSSRVRFVSYDAPFNFSTKCNLGARSATGEILIFFNDDVEAEQGDWIENVIEALENPEVGAVAPKLVYTTGKIQHAGLVTGVRGLVGTAFHQWPKDATEYSNYAQSLRPVSALSAACLAMRAPDFFHVGGFDEINTPIAHSDIDLCFKIREAGWRCVYTPFATLLHRGHASIGAAEMTAAPRPREKCSSFLLRRWSKFTGHDPYYTDEMRDWLYADSPTPVRWFTGDNRPDEREKWQRNVLFVSHDLSLSGAPVILAHAAKWLREHGVFAMVASPCDGPVRRILQEAEVPVLIDPLIATGYDAFLQFGKRLDRRSHPSFVELARQFDGVVSSTIFGAPLVHDARDAGVPCIWWIHEGQVGGHFLNRFGPALQPALEAASLVIAPHEASAEIYQPYVSTQVSVLTYGIPDVAREQVEVSRKPGPVRFLLLGTIERRKGQQTLLEALHQLPKNILEQTEFEVVGRPHEKELYDDLLREAASSKYLKVHGSVDHARALSFVREADVMLSTSRDETGPLTLLEAMALGKPIISTTVGAVAEKLRPEVDALFIPADDASALADAIIRLVSSAELRFRLGQQGRRAYEKHFTLERFGRDLLAMIEQVIGQPQPTPAMSATATTKAGFINA
ncbi:MAG: glycosyltransferase [Verrucomicrobiota bacterium]